MADRRGAPGEGQPQGGAAGAEVGARRRPSADPEALSIAIGARREALDAAFRAQADRPERARRNVQRRAPSLATATRAGLWRQAGAVAAVCLSVVAAGSGVYWAIPRLALGPPGAAEPTATDPAGDLTRAERRRVERLLARLDFRTGPVDGRIDARTRAAIARYRRFQGAADPHGRATPALLADLRAVAALAETAESTDGVTVAAEYASLGAVVLTGEAGPILGLLDSDDVSALVSRSDVEDRAGTATATATA